ncbi:FtsW/RodA/SpoVE family cell cycle protein [Bacillus sp. FJAT-27251]|uniref:FtsW/RodA/SpoVE family cell cycle protein n=1 Tax=Bacillus sp. FJAT-27251 TaxID=1684142 RepID=UPI0006A774C7|nr:FtsW/RodA/SpoVE family cell cycle protein [Bacillus sp. FJAT-27251]
MKSLKDSFLAEVLQQIKSREARDLVHNELNDHLQKSKAGFIAKGMNEKEAEEKAVLQMGSPTELGAQFNKLHRPKIDWLLLGLFVVALMMGFLPLLNIQELYHENLMVKQGVYMGIGILLAFAMMVVDYRRLAKWSWLFLGFGMLLLLALRFVPNAIVNGMPFIHIMGLSISGITAMPFLYLFWAGYLSQEKPRVWPMILIYLVTAFLFLSLPALPVVMIYSLLLFILFWTSAVSREIVYIASGVGACLAAICAALFWFMTAPYQKIRLLAFLEPEAYSENAGFMYLRNREWISGGGWFGNKAEPNPLPEMWTDFVFANVTYFYGWIAAGILVLVLSMLAIRMVMISGKIKDRFGRHLVIGAISLFSIQFLYNIGMSLGLLPIISISLPFISYGLTPALLNSFVIGIALSVYRRKDLGVGAGWRKA